MNTLVSTSMDCTFDVSAAVLAAFILWDTHERIVDKSLATRCKPFALPEKPTLTPSDVSIIIATITPDLDLLRALRLWKENNPREFIIVTVDQKLQEVKDFVQQAGSEIEAMTKVLALRAPDHRAQQSAGIMEATGKVIMLVDDDSFCQSPQCIKYLLAPLEDPSVGVVNNLQFPEVPADRQNAKVVTPWEHITVRGLDLFNGRLQIRFGADNTMWSIIGRTMIFRTETLQNSEFIEGFNNETFLGVSIKTGNDNFFSNFIRQKGLNLVLQSAPEAIITTATHHNSQVAMQMLRWNRNAIQNFVQNLTYRPGFFAMRRQYPYMARKMLERLLKPLLATVHFGAWIITLRSNPFFGVFVAVFYFIQWYKEYSVHTTAKYPWMAKYWWACFLWEWFGLNILEVYAWLTVRKEGWLTRNDSHVEVVVEDGSNNKKED